MKPKRSAEEDNILNFMIKKLHPVFLECICKCFNKWFSSSNFIDDRKLTKVITLNKLKTGYRIASKQDRYPFSQLILKYTKRFCLIEEENGQSQTTLYPMNNQSSAKADYY